MPAENNGSTITVSGDSAITAPFHTAFKLIPELDVGQLFLILRRGEMARASRSRYSRAPREWRSPDGPRRSLLEHSYLKDQVVRVATASKRPSVGLRSHAWQRACAHPSMASQVSTRFGLTKNPATNLRATRRDRTNVCMCHLDHLLQLPWARHRRVPPTEAARLKLIV